MPRSSEAEELENSFPFDMGRRFKDPEHVPFLVEIISEMKSGEGRKRKRNAFAEQKWRASVEALMSNIAAAHTNVIDNTRYVAVSFDRNSYNETELSFKALTQCRNYLSQNGLIDIAPGFQRWDADGIGKFGRRTRLRASPLLRKKIDDSDLGSRPFNRPTKQLIQLKAAAPALAAAIPPEVQDSRDLLVAINLRLASTDISIDPNLMPFLDYLKIDNDGEQPEERFRKMSYAGDLSATSLYRVFKYNWNSGGRIYGGWWMSLPRTIRPYITINGLPVVELDYKSLHPLLLYLRSNTTMPDDPYLIDPPGSSNMRNLGKRTFNRLLNKCQPDPKKRLIIRAARGDAVTLVKVPFKNYLNRFTNHLIDINKWFGTGEGIRLQYEDSIMALRVLKAMEEQSIPVLPIHDSFIVPVKYEDQLRAAMEEAFRSYGIKPSIERKGPKNLE